MAPVIPGKVVRHQTYDSREAALEAAGLSEECFGRKAALCMESSGSREMLRGLCRALSADIDRSATPRRGRLRIFGKVSDLMDTSQPPSHPHQQVVRRGRVSWLTKPPGGVARVTVESHAFGAIGVSVPEADAIPGEASPGELLAITHGMCMATVLSQALVEGGSSANELIVEVECTFAGPGPERELIALDLEVRGRVPGLDEARFREAADNARPRYLRFIGARDDMPGDLEAVLESSAPLES